MQASRDLTCCCLSTPSDLKAGKSRPRSLARLSSWIITCHIKGRTDGRRARREEEEGCMHACMQAICAHRVVDPLEVLRLHACVHGCMLQAICAHRVVDPLEVLLAALEKHPLASLARR